MHLRMECHPGPQCPKLKDAARRRKYEAWWMNEMSVPAPLKQAEEKDKSKTWDEELLESVFEPRTCY
jgi:hypothetical protein